MQARISSTNPFPHYIKPQGFALGSAYAYSLRFFGCGLSIQRNTNLLFYSPCKVFGFPYDTSHHDSHVRTLLCSLRNQNGTHNKTHQTSSKNDTLPERRNNFEIHDVESPLPSSQYSTETDDPALIRFIRNFISISNSYHCLTSHETLQRSRS